MMLYTIAQHSLEMGPRAGLDKAWNAFRGGNDEAEVAVILHQLDYQGKSYNEGSCFDIPFAARHSFVCDDSVLVCDSSWQDAAILTSKSVEHTQVLLLQLHCATIDDGGRGVLFLGPSGIGKTTQAERWAEFRGASILNGDIGFVQRTGQGYLAWGTPWHGSSPYCLNASVPVKALVVLKQAPENRLRELTGFEKVSEIAGSVFYPTWLEDGMELCTDTLNHLLTDLPVYRLDNRADRESVEILAKELDRIT